MFSGRIGFIYVLVRFSEHPPRIANALVPAIYLSRKRFVSAVKEATYFPGEQFILTGQTSPGYLPGDCWRVGEGTG